MHAWLVDTRIAWRTLWSRANQGYSLAVILSFALGIAAATAIVSIAYAMLYAPLPYAQPDRVLRVYDSNVERGLPEFSVSMPNYLSWIQRSREFSALAALSSRSLNIGEAGRVERVSGALSSANLWQVLGQPLVAGRGFSAEEDRRNGAKVVILGEALWRNQFAADPELIGRNVRVNGADHQVIGIAAQDVGFATNIAAWLPLRADPETYGRGDRRLLVLGSLAAGATLESAQAELTAISAALAQEFPNENAGWVAAAQPIRDWVVGDTARQRLGLLLAAAALLMLVACTNVANLQFARATVRGRELGVRQALGASRARMIAQMAAENLMLAAIGGLLGVLLAELALRAAVAVLPPTTPRLIAFAVDWRAAVAATAFAATSALAFGVAPALAALRRQLATVLAQAGRSSLRSRSGSTRQGLIVVQFTLATVLVVTAVALAQHLTQLQGSSLGFGTEKLLVTRLTLPQSEGYDVDMRPHRQTFRAVLEAVEAIPGVRSAGLSSEVPLGQINTTSMMVAAGGGGPLSYEHNSVHASWRIASQNYLATLGVPLLRGRWFDDNEESSRSLIVSEDLAGRLWPTGEDPLGRTVRLSNGQQRTIVGVVGDVRQLGLGEDPTPTMYMPLNWIVTETMNLVVRSEAEPAALIASIRAASESVAPDHPLFDIRTVDQLIDASVAEPRVQTLVLSAFSLTSLILAAFGIAGVMSYLIAMRTPELALRLALGASPRRLIAGLLGRGGALSLAGVTLGTVILWLLARALGDSWGASPPVSSLLLGTGAMLLVGLVSSWLPSRSAARISPNAALRAD